MATTQNLSEVLTQSKLAVVPFPAPQQISQLEVSLLISLRGRLHQLQEQVEAAEESIKSRLRAGCSVEEGDHAVELKTSYRRNVSWKDVSIRLANKLYFGKGLSYVERILRKTKPMPSTSLVIQ